MLNRIAVVIVTYNRIKCLKKAILAYENQTKLPNYIVIVNNDSNDGTKEYLDEWEKLDTGIKKIVINNDENVGGSGGFYIGFKKSLELDVDWVWVSDDDAYPESNVIKSLFDFYDENSNKNIVSMCTSVVEHGKFSLSHRNLFINKFSNPFEMYIREDKYKDNYFEINEFSYVGTMIKKEAIKKAGITDKDFFIYFDDVDHGLRISKIGKIICVPSLKVYHDGYLPINCEKYIKKFTWKDYYSFRNQLICFHKYFKKIFWFLFLRRELLVIIKILFHLNQYKYMDRRYAKLVFSAVFDAIFNRMGVHKVYKPGWKLC